jgi:hypothetical protein
MSILTIYFIKNKVMKKSKYNMIYCIKWFNYTFNFFITLNFLIKQIVNVNIKNQTWQIFQDGVYSNKFDSRIVLFNTVRSCYCAVQYSMILWICCSIWDCSLRYNAVVSLFSTVPSVIVLINTLLRLCCSVATCCDVLWKNDLVIVLFSSPYILFKKNWEDSV